MTILQLLEAEEVHPKGETRLDDNELTKISLVAQVQNITRLTTNTTYKLDDGTGTIEAKEWNEADAFMGGGGGGGGGLGGGLGLGDDDDDDNKDGIKGEDDDKDNGGGGGGGGGRPWLRTHAWVRILGKLGFLNNRRHVTVAVMRAVKDKNEINFHLLEATYVHLYFSKGPPETLNGGGGGGGDGGAGAGAGGGASAPGGGGGGGGGSTSEAARGLTGVTRRTYTHLIETPQTNEGLHAQEIAAKLNIPVSDVHRAAEELVAKALIYTTVDDFTYAPLDA